MRAVSTSTPPRNPIRRRRSHAAALSAWLVAGLGFGAAEAQAAYPKPVWKRPGTQPRALPTKEAAPAHDEAGLSALEPKPPLSASEQRKAQEARYARDELGLSALELLVGVAVGGAGIGGAIVFSDGDDVSGMAMVSLLATPALQGLAICGVGKLSQRYDTGCGWPIAGAYIGAAALALPFMLLLSGEFGEGAAAAPSMGIGVLISAPIGGLWAWNVDKQALAAPVALPHATTVQGHFSRSPSVAPAAAVEATLLGPPVRATVFRVVAGSF